MKQRNTNILVFSLIFLLIGFIVYYFTCVFMVLDEDRIIEDSQAAFEAEQFDPWVLDQTMKLQNLGNYLLQNADQIVSQSQKTTTTISTDKHNIKRTHTKKDMKPCQYIYIKTDNEPRISQVTLDSINQLISTIGHEHIYWIRLCTDNRSTEHNATIKLNKNKKDKLNPHYYLEHLIYFNQTTTNNDHTNSIYTPLHKSKTIANNITYGIKVSPYSGF